MGPNPERARRKQMNDNDNPQPEDKSKAPEDDLYINPTSDSTDGGLDFDFVDMYDEDPIVHDERLLPDNTAGAAISCGFVGIGGGGGKISKIIFRSWL